MMDARDDQQPDPPKDPEFGRADRAPTPEEEAAADASRDSADADVAEHYEAMAEAGARLQGEGEIEGVRHEPDGGARP